MSKQSIDALYALVERKNLIDQNATWSNGSSTYLEEIGNELEEVRAEIGQNRGPALEEELGDVLWDFLNLVRCLEAEESISLEAVLNRAEQKYRERIDAIESGGTWKDIKLKQKKRLANELLGHQESDL